MVTCARHTLAVTGPGTDVLELVAAVRDGECPGAVGDELRGWMTRPVDWAGAEPGNPASGVPVDLPNGRARVVWTFQTPGPTPWSELALMFSAWPRLDAVLTWQDCGEGGVEHWPTCPPNTARPDSGMGTTVVDFAVTHPNGGALVTHTLDLRRRGGAGTTREALLGLLRAHLPESVGDHYVVVLGDPTEVEDAFGLDPWAGRDEDLVWMHLPSEATIIQATPELTVRQTAQAGRSVLRRWWSTGGRTDRWQAMERDSDLGLVVRTTPEEVRGLGAAEQRTLLQLLFAVRVGCSPDNANGRRFVNEAVAAGQAVAAAQLLAPGYWGRRPREVADALRAALS